MSQQKQGENEIPQNIPVYQGYPVQGLPQMYPQGYPVYPFPGQNPQGPPMYPQGYPCTYQVYPSQIPPSTLPAPETNQQVIICADEPYGGDPTCAWIGCAFSWIPLIGFLNTCINCSAPSGSSRRKAAILSLIVATFFLIVNIIWILSLAARHHDD